MPIRLYRSRIEIARFLRKLADRGALLWTFVDGGDHMVFTRLVHVDPFEDWIAVAFSAASEDNRRLMAMESLVLRSSHGGSLVQFSAADPVEIEHGGALALRARFPAGLLLHPYHQESQPRIPPRVPLRCIADAGGFAPFEAEIVDLSNVGVGMLECDAGIRLPKSAVLGGSRIFHPVAGELTADLEIRSARLVRRGSRLVQSAGFRFLQRPLDLDRFVSLFISTLDKARRA